ncbi:hypothetical protein L2E82_12541 [Cichorium intybus]|uniref:Uncharacterized protein n=1 Tax=Cichorium intybus TaxID=13427 RepID=A0ACB9GHH0_CICIN|nr:hypothetical protein L2E82_12541 [Cichorium intybus]
MGYRLCGPEERKIMFSRHMIFNGNQNHTTISKLNLEQGFKENGEEEKISGNMNNNASTPSSPSTTSHDVIEAITPTRTPPPSLQDSSSESPPCKFRSLEDIYSNTYALLQVIHYPLKLPLLMKMGRKLW